MFLNWVKNNLIKDSKTPLDLYVSIISGVKDMIQDIKKYREEGNIFQKTKEIAKLYGEFLA